MGYLLAIDPGPTKSGIVIVDDLWWEGLGYKVVASGEPPTDDVIDFVRKGSVDILCLKGISHEDSFSEDTQYPIIDGRFEYTALVCEDIVPMGKFGGSLIDTCKKIGRMQEAYEYQHGEVMSFVSRREEKKILSKLSGIKVKNDATMNQAIMMIYPKTGGGKKPAVGTKNKPGPLYGVTGHSKQALAVAITYLKKQNI